jgi:RNA polymerase sigma-70 factor (ECF subfamily)
MAKKAMDIEALCRRYAPMVMRRCRKLLRNEDEAMDVCQDVFVQLLRHRERLHARYPSSLLYRIATNLCLNRLRDSGRRPFTAADELLMRVAAHDDHGAQAQARSILDRLFVRHPESSRTMAVLHYLDGLTLEEVAAEVGMSISGVRKRLRELRTSLKALEGP